MATLYAESESKSDEMVANADKIASLDNRLNDKIKEYSKGMLRRLLVARALMMKPKLAILDEPTSGLDVSHSYYVRESIKKYAKEHKVTVIVSSHNMLEVDFICDRVGLINNGKIVVEGSPKNLKTMYKAENLEQVFMKVVKVA
jgi:ABC-2 type transport system ATP-binding protein